VKYLKIDGGYTETSTMKPITSSLSRHVADTAHSVDIRVFAEAVESEEELDAIRSLNVDGVQGYLVGKPEFL
jgi:EAL domain-containing protein (putative c-di-GMP-specific phosphodiesterase class I)